MSRARRVKDKSSTRQARGEFAHGRVDPVEAGRKGGQASQAAAQAASSPWQGSLEELADAAGMSDASWAPWRSLLRASLGQLKGDGDRAFLYGHGGGRKTPPIDVRECWIAAGRRAGKSRVAALVATWKAVSFDTGTLAPGELAVVPIIAADRAQARAVMGYVRALCSLPAVRPWVGRVLRETIELKSGVNIEVHTASYRTVRGYTVISAVLDEVAFWRDESTSANPDTEIIAALRPAMSTVPGALLVAISSPYARTGEFFRTHDRYYGADDAHTIVWNADSRSLNPTVPERIIARAFEEDPAAAASEYGQDGHVVFRTDVESFLDPEAVRAVTVTDRRELPSTVGLTYRAFVDPSGGRGDSFTLAIAHREGDTVVLDALRERRPPFSPDEVVEDYARLLATYGVRKVSGDRYGGEWPREAFRRHGVAYEPSLGPPGIPCDPW